MAAPDLPLPRPSLAWWVFAALVAYAFVWTLGETGFDDSYFFKRFALNFLHHGMFAWNVQDGPVYGSTSQLFQLVATLLTALVPDHYITAAKCFNALCVLVLGGLLVKCCALQTRAADFGRSIAVLGLATPVVLSTVGTGMETALALVLVAAALVWQLLQLRAQHPLSWRLEGQAALWTVLTYSCRPDAALIVACVFVLGHVLQRRWPWRFALLLSALMLALLGLFHAYYGTALPLPYYMKTFTQSIYDPHVVALGRHVKGWYVACFVCFTAPLWWLSAWRRDALTLALMCSGAAFFVYHWVFTYEFMGSRSRFYAPAVVPLVLAAARSWDAFSERARPAYTLVFLFIWAGAMAAAYQARWVPTHEGFFLDQIHWPAYAATAAAWALLLLGGGWLQRRADAPTGSGSPRMPGSMPVLGLTLLLGVTLALGFALWWKPKRPTVLDDEQTLRKASSEASTTRGMFDVARCLPNAKNVYHSEMGITGLALIHLRTVDMVGLLSKDTVLHNKTFEQYCAEDRPEAIFLPHKNYQRLNQLIRDSACFQDYRQMTFRSSSPLYVRADLSNDFRKCATEIQRWR